MAKRVRPPGYYQEQYAKYHGTPEYKKRRAMANAARATLKDELGAAALRGKDVDHKRTLKSGGSNARSNLRVRSRAANRASK